MTRNDPKIALAVLMLVALAARLPAFILAGPSGPVSLLSRLPALAGDLGLVWVLYRVSFQLSPPGNGPKPERWAFLDQRAFWPALAWAANPLAVLAGLGPVQTDSLALLSLMLAVYFFEFSSHPRSDRLAALGLGCALSLKPAFFFLAPLFVKNLQPGRERREFLIWMLLPLAISLVLWLPGNPFGLLEPLSGKGVAGAFSLPAAIQSASAWGLSPQAGARLTEAGQAACLCFLGGLFLIYCLGRWRFPLLPGLGLGMLSLYCFAPALPAPAMLWLVPVSLLILRPLSMRHLFAGLGMTLIFYLAFAPEAVFNPSFLSARPARPAFLLVWAALNLALWLFWLKEWRVLLRWCLRPPGWIHY